MIAGRLHTQPVHTHVNRRTGCGSVSARARGTDVGAHWLHDFLVANLLDGFQPGVVFRLDAAASGTKRGFSEGRFIAASKV